MEVEVILDKDSNKDLPWQITAKKLIKFASEFNKTDDEFKRQVGYLLLDVGLETLLRSYLTIPNAKSSSEFRQREEAAKGVVEKDGIAGKKITLSSFDELSFHNLVLAVKQVSGGVIHEGTFEKVEYFHNIRNKIYHLGDGIVPTKQIFEEYLALAQSLLKVLLGVDNVADVKDEPGSFSWGDINLAGFVIFKESDFEGFELNVAIATEILRPEYALRSFEVKLNKIKQLYDRANVRDSQQERKEMFNKLMGTEIEDIGFIEERIEDITFLRLIALRSKIDIDENDMKKYLEYREWAKTPSKSIEEVTPEYIRYLEDLMNWNHKISEKIKTLIEPYITQ